MTATTALHVRMVLPDGWIDLDLDLELEPAARNAAIDALVAERTGTITAAAEIRSAMAALLRSASARARDAGAVVAAFYADVEDGRPFMIAASLIVTMHLTGGDMSIEHLQTDLADRKVTMARLETSAGPCVRLTPAIDDRAAGQDESIDMFMARYFIPFGTDAGVLVVSFSTPNLGVEDEWLELFDAMTRTVEIEGNTRRSVSL